MHFHRDVSFVRPPLVLALLTAAVLTGCGGSGNVAAPAGPSASASLSPSDADSRHPTCSSFVYPTLATTRVSVPAGGCLSFEHYSDITAVITDVRPADGTLFANLDALTYRGVHAGSTVFSVNTKREICTATATCQVPNPVKQLAVSVTKTD